MDRNEKLTEKARALRRRMTKEEALRKTKGYLTNIIPQEDYAEVEEIVKALEQEPCPYWDYGLNTCRHANIGALATVTPIRPKGEWKYDKTIQNWRCSNCNETPKTLGYVGTKEFMTEHFKFCNHCGADMRGEQK